MGEGGPLLLSMLNEFIHSYRNTMASVVELCCLLLLFSGTTGIVLDNSAVLLSTDPQASCNQYSTVVCEVSCMCANIGKSTKLEYCSLLDAEINEACVHLTR